MEDESNLVIIKTEIKEETPEDPSTAINHFSPYKEHNYNEVMSEEYYNSIDSKDQTEKYIKSENCCLDKASDQPLRIKTKLCASNLEEFNKKKLKRIEKPGCSEIVLLRNKEQKIKKEVFDCELTDLHHSIDIKEEDDRTGCSEVEEVDSDVQEEEYSVADINAQGSPCTSGTRVVTRKYLYEQMQEQDLPNFDKKLAYLQNHLLSCYGDTPDNCNSLKQRFSYFKSSFKEKWSKAYRKEEVFLKTNEAWLKGTFKLTISNQNRPGRPSKSFEDSSERSKRRKTEEIRSSATDEVIVHAAQTALQAQGKRDSSKILKEITSSPTRAGKYRNLRRKAEKKEITSLTPMEALAMFVEADLTKRQYEIIRNTNKSFYPCYDLLLKEKKGVLPSQRLCESHKYHG